MSSQASRKFKKKTKVFKKRSYSDKDDWMIHHLWTQEMMDVGEEGRKGRKRENDVLPFSMAHRFALDSLVSGRVGWIKVGKEKRNEQWLSVKIDMVMVLWCVVVCCGVVWCCVVLCGGDVMCAVLSYIWNMWSHSTALAIGMLIASKEWTLASANKTSNHRYGRQWNEEMVIREGIESSNYRSFFSFFFFLFKIILLQNEWREYNKIKLLVAAILGLKLCFPSDQQS